MSQKQEKLTQNEINQIAKAITIGDTSKKRTKKKKEKTAPQISYDAFNVAEKLKSKLDEQIKETGNMYHPFDFSDMNELEKEDISQRCVKAGNEYLKSLKQESKPENYNPLIAIERAYEMYEKAGHFCSNFKKKRTLVKTTTALEEILKKHKGGKTTLSLSIASFVLALFFSALNITGNAVGTIEQDFSILGILFFILGLALTFFYVRSKR